MELAGSRIGDWAQTHPIWAAVTILGTVVGSTVTVRKLELPVYRWARDWLNKRLDGLGKRLNASLETKIELQSQELAAMQLTVTQLRETLASHELVADRRRADDYRRDILRFNRELMAGAAPDRESYVEALAIIDRYEGYCREHPDYPNSRATAAIENIKQHYQHCLVVGFREEVHHG